MTPNLLRRRRRFVHGPTPIARIPRLADRFGVDLWIKRDDATGGAEAGNKLRKLEFLVEDALTRDADTLVTGGHVHSNHARATAIVAASLGLHCELRLWSDDPMAALPPAGNELLARMAGATIRRVGPTPPSARDALLRQAAHEVVVHGRRPYVIPEGGSNGMGALGYVQACREIRAQLDRGIAHGEAFDVIVAACGSGGTLAGLAVGAATFRLAKRVHGVAVAGSASSLHCAVGRIIEQVHRLEPTLDAPVTWAIDDPCRGEHQLTTDKRRFMIEMGRYGLILDPVYTGPALRGLAQAIREDGRWVGKRVLFVHTGGLPGLLSGDFGLSDA